MVEKRGNEDNGNDGDGSAAKKARGDDAPAAAPKRPALSLEALEKAKKALQLQKELKEKLKKLPQLQKPPSAPVAVPMIGNPLLATGTAKAAQIAASFGLPVAVPPSLTSTSAASLAATAAAAAAAAAFRPPAGSASLVGFRAPALKLDPQGREVDEQGNVISRPVKVMTTLKVNQQHASAGLQSAAPGAASVNPLLESAPPDALNLEADPGFDARMGAPALKKMARRRKATFDFVQEGTFQKQAEIMRLKAKFGDAAIKRSSALLLPKAPIGPSVNPNDVPIGINPNLVPIGDANLVPIGVRRDPGADPLASTETAESEKAGPPPPDVEWWDRNLLASGSYETDIRDEVVAIKESKITLYVEHPVAIEPPAEPAAPPPQPLKLTKKELKKLRTQRRQAREKEKQDLIRQGLLEPPKPKVKIANLYRVMGEQAVADPTAMEKEARKQMAERQAAHDDRNLARKLLPTERREKKLHKLFDDNGIDVITTVYKVTRLSNKQHRFKVDINAKENHMTGLILISDEFCLVVVEGCSKSAKRYMKLMLRRIDWTVEADNDEVDDDEGDEGGDNMHEDSVKRAQNACDMVWQGTVKQRAFKKFTTESIPDTTQAKAVLEAHNVGHYWDIASAFNRDEAPRIVLD